VDRHHPHHHRYLLTNADVPRGGNTVKITPMYTEQQIRQAIAKASIQHREKNNLTQKKFARQICIKRCTLASYESLHRTPSLINAYRIANAIGVSLYELVKDGYAE
jgi:DNA-binding XRE family transcriptional regulator